MKLVSNWRSALKMLSVQLSLLGTTLATSYATFNADLKEYIDPSTMGWLTAATFILSVVARLIDQGLAIPPQPEQPSE